MTLSIPRRVLAVVLTLWVALFMGESEWIVRCPAHATTRAGAAEAPGSAAHGTHHAAGIVAAASPHDHGSPAGPPGSAGPASGGAHGAEHGHGEAHQCACPGPGCSAPALAVVPTVADPLSRLVAIHTDVAFATLDRLADAPDHLLPYATAPPVAPLAPAA